MTAAEEFDPKLRPTNPPATGNPEVVSQDAAHRHNEDKSALSGAALLGRRVVGGCVLAFEFSPANELSRYGIGTAVYAATGRPEYGAAALLATTLVTEGASAVAGADLLHSPSVNNMVVKVNEKIDGYLERRGVNTDGRVNPAIKAAVGYIGGSVPLQAIRRREHPEATVAQDIVYGIESAVVIAVAAAAPFYMTLRGVDTPSKETITTGLLGLGGAVGLYSICKRKLSRNRSADSADATNPAINEETGNFDG